ncbi:GNAT family N-acetyltransferase [Lysobacteraceae bacterium NML08-0793]|nr:GNAT family N-acetyltransferase [Xanthomonadaceae bacterium NML08-0793]
MTQIQPVTLQLGDVRLLPLRLEYAQSLAAATGDGELWTLPFTSAPQNTLADCQRYIEKALEGEARGQMLPFAVEVAGEIVGTTRYYDISLDVPRLNIGHTWYAARVQRSHVNSSCKRLLLGHAFDTLGMRTVYLKTSTDNLRSRAAIERLGAQCDGILRQHRRHKDGSLGDTVFYSILDSEWPAIRARLDAGLKA